MQRKYLQIPGPTNIPDNILRSLSQPMINHRGPEFEKLLSECLSGVKEILNTDSDLLFFPSSGSGALESTIVNLFSQGDTIAVSSHGVFSDRVAVIAERYGVNVIRISKPWGQAIKPEDVKGVLENNTDKNIKAVYVAQNETTSGVENNIASIGKAIYEFNPEILFAVDAVSSLACVPYEMDKWHVDVTVSASQKGFMLPPGLSMVALNEKAWKLYEKSTLPKWYWDYKAVKEKNKVGQMPYTPATALLFGLQESLKTIKEEGKENIYARHSFNSELVRKGIEAMGLKLFAEEGYRSKTVTAVEMPEGIEFKPFSKLLRTKYGVIIGGGLSKLEGKIFRIGHMGSLSMMEVYSILGAVELALYESGYKVELGTTSKAIGNYIFNNN